MQYKLVIKREAQKQILAIPKTDITRIDSAIIRLSDNMQGDVKKLRNFIPRYRLRVGNYRILFEIEKDTVVIHAVKHRRESYQ